MNQTRNPAGWWKERKRNRVDPNERLPTIEADAREPTPAASGDWFVMVVCGWLLYAISLISPAAEAEVFTSTMRISGVEAALHSIVGGIDTLTSPTQEGANLWIPIFFVFSTLTNLLILGSLVTIRHRRPSKWIGVVVLAFALVNLGWLTDPVQAEALGAEILPGYYAWLFSYGLIGTGHLIGVRSTKPTTA